MARNPRDPNRSTENEVAFAIVQIARAQPSGIATFARCRREVPHHLHLTAGDLAPSITRNGEAMWEQLIRNIKSHYNVEGNYLYEGYLEHVPKVGYRVTEAGRRRTYP